MTIGELIRTARKAAGFTQARLAKELNVTQYGVSSWELGIVFPKFKHIQVISALTNTPLEELKTALVQTRLNNMEHGKPQAAATKDCQQKTLRDEFAMAALQGLIACPSTEGTHDYFAEVSYKFADAMMKERSK